MATAAALCSLLVAGVTTVHFSLTDDGSPTFADYFSRSGISDNIVVSIGVPDDRPLLGYRDSGGALAGFDVELARYIANSLKLPYELVTAAAADRIRFITEGIVDIVVADLAMTDERESQVDFAGPYLVTDQSLLVPSSVAGDFENTIRWRGFRPCVVAGTSSEYAYRTDGPTMVVASSIADCVERLRAGEVDAVANDTVQLLGYTEQLNGQVRLIKAPVEGPVAYGIAVSKNDPYLRALIQSFLLVAKAKGTSGSWSVAYRNTLGTAGPTPEQPKVDGVVLRDSDDGQYAAMKPSGHTGFVGSPRPPPSRRMFRPRNPNRRRARAKPIQDSLEVRPAAPHAAGRVASDPDSPGRQALWPVLVGVPAAVSALYLWIQSGGDRQFTLMLSSVWIFLAVPPVLFAMNGAMTSSTTDDTDRQDLRRRHPIIAWVSDRPPWLISASFGAAVVTSPLIFAPAWLLACCMAFQTRLFRRLRSPHIRVVIASSLTAVTVLVGVITDGSGTLAFMTAWPIGMLILGADGPIMRRFIDGFVRATAVLATLLVGGVIYNTVTTPILPSTVITIGRDSTTAAPDSTTVLPSETWQAGTAATSRPVDEHSPTVPTTSGAASPPDSDVSLANSEGERSLRGYIVSENDESTTILLDTGGVAIVPNSGIRSRVSCPSAVDLPGDTDRLFGIPLRQSLLHYLARRQRPAAIQDPRCVIRPDDWTTP